MKILFQLTLKSMSYRWLGCLLTATSLILSVFLLLSVQRVQRAAEQGFTQSVSQVDLLVGARTGPLNLILYTVFNMGSATNNISWQTYQKIKSLPEVAWTIPYSLGDGHRGFRVVATDESFFEHYRFRRDQKIELKEGETQLGLWSVILGSDVQRKLKYKIGDEVIIAHGVTRTEGILLHNDKPFRVLGIMKPTGTALDQSLYISLKGMEAIHLDWQSGSAPKPNEHISAAQINEKEIEIKSVTAFFLRTQSRLETLSLQRKINEFDEEPLLAIIPGATLSELWRGLSQIDVVLKIISWMVFAVGVASMASSLLSGLNERRREMAILRTLGASSGFLVSLFIVESFVLTLFGVISGVILSLFSTWAIAGWIEAQFGFSIQGELFTSQELWPLVLMLFFGTCVGLIPALKAKAVALKDGLSGQF